MITYDVMIFREKLFGIKELLT